MWRNRWYILAVLAGLASVGPASARVYPVKDQADLIQNKATLDKLNQVIKEIDQKFGKEVLIETFPSVPPGDVDRVKAMDKEARKQYFFEQARNRAKSHRINGFYIFANKSPVNFLEVLEDNKTGQAMSIERDVRDIMRKHFVKEQYDEGFLKGVEYIRDQLTAHPPARAVAPVGRPRAAPAAGNQETNWAGIICIGAVVLLVVWLIIGLMRSRSAAGGGMAGAGAGGGGGGGFMTGLLGGLFGAMAGNWLYHNVFGGGFGSQAYGDSGGTSPGDTDYTGAGGEWDDAGGGGGGGGDAGGGDWGGGGGDWGGGGGDW